MVFLSLSVFYLQFYDHIKAYAKYSEATGDVLMVSLCLYYFYSALRKEEHTDFFTDEYFWLSIGVLFSSIIGGILYLFPNSLDAFKTKTKVNVSALINNVLNLLLYGSLMAAFICRKKNQK